METKQNSNQSVNQIRLKEVLAIVNQKGGVGKTTTVQSLAVALMRHCKSWHILVIDLDPQGDLSKLMHWDAEFGDRPTVTDALAEERGRLPIYKSDRGVYYVPSSKELQNIEPKMMDQMKYLHPYLLLRQRLLGEIEDCTGEGITSIPEWFDYVLIDCSPALSMCTYNAMGAASGLLIPVQMEGLSVDGIGSIVVEMAQMQQGLNPQLQLRGLLPVMVDARPNIVKGFISYLRTAYGDNVTQTTIPRSVKVNEAQTKKQDIYEYKQWSPAACAYESLVKELFD